MENLLKEKYPLHNLPIRAEKNRNNGITMVMDKGLSLREAEDFASIAANYVDFIKFGFGSSYVTNCLKDKIKTYKNHNIQPYLGGTLLEIYWAKNQIEDFLSAVDELKLETIEVSDGSITLPHDEKCELIHRLSKNFQVLSEVGSKDAEVIIAPYQWIELMQKEIDAGSWKVIAEAREGGNVGIFRGTGEVRSGLVQEILTKIPQERIIWEAPNKAQQVYFIKLLGANVNLGNISIQEAIPLETLRLGLRGDTFHHFLT